MSDAASAPLTPEQIRELRELLEKATPGPWRANAVPVKVFMSGAGEWATAIDTRIVTDWDHPQAKGPLEITALTAGTGEHGLKHMVGIDAADAELICALRNHADALLTLCDSQALALTQQEQEIADLRAKLDNAWASYQHEVRQLQSANAALTAELDTLKRQLDVQEIVLKVSHD